MGVSRPFCRKDALVYSETSAVTSRCPKGPRSLGVRLAFGDVFPVEMGQGVDEMCVVEHYRAVSADGQGVFVARRWRPVGVR